MFFVFHLKAQKGITLKCEDIFSKIVLQTYLLLDNVCQIVSDAKTSLHQHSLYFGVPTKT